jgi:hypothetical protein
MMWLSIGYICYPTKYLPILLFVQRRRYDPHHSNPTYFGTRQHGDFGDFGEPGDACDPERGSSVMTPSRKTLCSGTSAAGARHPKRATLITVGEGVPRDLTVQ